jgi:hypothetical protein
LSAGSSKVSVSGGTGAVIGSGASVDLGAVTLDDLSNVTVPSPSTNDILTYNGSAWVNAGAPAASLPLAGGTMTGDITMSNQKAIIFKETTGNGTDSVTLKAPASVTTSYTLQLPPALGTGNQTLVDTAGDGVLTWGASGGATVSQITYTVGTASGTYTGSTTLFNLPFAYVQDAKSLQIFYNGQVLIQGIDYTETSTTSVTMTNALVSGASVVFRTMVSSTQIVGAVSQYVNYTVGTSSGSYNGSLTQFDLPFSYLQDGKTIEVFYDGVKLTPTDDYSESTSTRVTTTTSLTSGRKIQFKALSSAGVAPAVTVLRENYVVGTASGNYTGSTTVFDLVNSYTPGGTNLQVYLDGDLQTIGASVDYVETDGNTVTFNNALVSGQKVAFLFSQTVASGGTVGSGTATQVAYYPSTGSTTSSSSALTVSGTGKAGFPTGTSTDNSVQDARNARTGISFEGGPTTEQLNMYCRGVSVVSTNSASTWVGNAGSCNGVIAGTNTNDNASAGYVGEFVMSGLGWGSGATLSNGVAKTVTSISLTAGDWDITVLSGFEPGGGTVMQAVASAISLTTDSVPTSTYYWSPNATNGEVCGEHNIQPNSTPGHNPVMGPALTTRMKFASTTTVYYTVRANFTTSTCLGFGSIQARRRR